MKKSFLPLATTSLILSAFLAQGEQVQAEEQPAAEYAATDKLAESSLAPDLAGPVDEAPTRPESAPTRTGAASSEDASSSASDDSQQAYRKEQDQKVIEEYEALVEAPIEVVLDEHKGNIAFPAMPEPDDVIHKQTFTDTKVVVKSEEVPILNLNAELDAPVILESTVKLDQGKTKEDGLTAIKELRSIVWDMEANSELIGEQINPKTGERVEGVWINGERLRDRLKTEGISTKEEYVNRVSWNSDLENLALLNLAEANQFYWPMYWTLNTSEFSKNTKAKENYSGKITAGIRDYSDNYPMVYNVLLNNIGLSYITKHNLNRGKQQLGEEVDLSYYLNLVLDPINQSFALAANYTDNNHETENSVDLLTIVGSTDYKDYNSTNAYKGTFKILYNQNYKENSKYHISDLSSIYEKKHYRLNIKTNSLKTYFRNVHAFKGNNVSLNPDVIQFNDDGSISALKPGTAVLIINIEGTMKSMKVEVLPSPIVEDKITVWDSEYVNTTYVRNPDMFEGEERVKVEGHPSLRYRLIRDTSSVDGHLLNRELLKDWEIPAIDRIVEVGTKERNIKQPAPKDRPVPVVTDKKAEPGDIITGHLYETIPGYFEALPGYHIRLVPESEDQVLRINEQNFKTVIQPLDDLALGEHVIIQDGVNRYTEITNRIYKDHQNNILKTQEISRQDFPGQDLIIGLGTGKGQSGLPAEEEPSLPVHPQEPDSPRPPSTEQAVDTNPRGEMSRGPVERPQAMPQGQSEGEEVSSTHTEELMTSDDSLRISDDSVSNSYDQVKEEAGMDHISPISESMAPGSVAPEHLLTANPDKAKKAPTLLPSSKLGVRSEALASQSTDRAKVSSVKPQLHHQSVQTKLSNQSSLRRSAEATANAPRVFTQLPQTGGGSDQTMLGIGLSSLVVGLLLRLSSFKKRRNN
ncbi:G5 domain-containing protein [Aerococcus sp. UMB1112A]|uniref:G5 domain-containing protein n=1 Tax=Aerococcus sp. UMB1112A TaxID=3050609 RepID=UPI00254EE70B|nr:G5 domain-containing protein [Aerococcus sp. UMB1112A]MDK8503301.1 G5 domain-containing protein [Aerococcus sp. UMB1112A]